MGILRIPITVLVLLIAMTVLASAQTYNEYIDCDDISESSVDTLRLQGFQGRPGDTVWLPIHLKSVDTVSGFMVLIEWDEQYLTPVPDPLYPTSEYVWYSLEGALENAWLNSADTSEHPLYAQISPLEADSGAIIVGFNLGFSGGSGEKPLRLNPLAGEVVVRIAFEVSAAMPDASTAGFRHFEVNECVLTDPQNQVWFCADCRRSSLSVDRSENRTLCRDSSIASVDEEVIPWDTTWVCDVTYDTVVTGTYVTYPSSIDGLFTANLTPPPEIYSFTGPDTVQPSSAFALEWTAANADSIIIRFQSGVIHTDLNLDYFVSLTAPASEGSYQYELEAINEFGSETAYVTVVVKGGAPPDEHAPTISVVSVHSVDVGATLNFTVSSADIDNDFITLEAVDLPTNASFPQATGTGSASSQFSFTPSVSQVGNIVVTFRASAAGDVTTALVTIVVNEPDYDKLFSSSTESNPIGGIHGGVQEQEGIGFPVNLVTSQIVYGIQFDFLYDAQKLEVTDVMATDNTSEYVVYDNIGKTPGQVRFVTLGMANEPMGTEGTQIMNVIMAVDRDAAAGRYAVYLDNAWESVNPDPEYPSLPLLADSGVFQVDTTGDVNLDMKVDIADLVSVVGYIIGDYGFNTRRFDLGDINVDAAVNVFDLVAIIGVVFDGTAQTSPGLFYESQLATVRLAYDDLGTGASDVMVVTSEVPIDIAGVELEILYDPAAVALGDPQLAMDVDGMDLRYRDNQAGRLKVLMIPRGSVQSSDIVHAGSPDLVEIPITARAEMVFGDQSQIRLNQALLATAEATAVRVENIDGPLPTSFVLHQNYPNPFNPTTTIAFSFGSQGGGGISQRVTLDIFNILGQSVTNILDGYLPPGNHEVSWDGTDRRGRSVASGIYLYRLSVGEESQSKKMLLLK